MRKIGLSPSGSKESLAIDRKIGYEQGIATHLGNIGVIYSALGKPQEALKYLKDALAIFDRIQAQPQKHMVSNWIKAIENQKDKTN